MNVTYQREILAVILPEMQPLFPLHWAELALNRDHIKLDPDIEKYLAAERAGLLHVVTARQDGLLVGYYVSVVQPHPHYKNDLMSVSDMFFVLPEHRKGAIGMGLFGAAEKDARESGAKVIMTVTKLSHPIGPMLEYFGWEETGKVYSKFIGG